MDNELRNDFRSRAKQFLQIDGNPSLIELSKLLRQYRNATHPDRFQDVELKQKADARFKDAQTLLDETEKEIESEFFDRKPSELAVYKPVYDDFQIESRLDRTKKELESVRLELRNERESKHRLIKKVQQRKDESLDEEIYRFHADFRLSNRRYASMGMALALTGLLTAMTQMDQASGILEGFSPVMQGAIITFLVACLVLIFTTIVRQIWETDYIKQKSDEVLSPKCADEFMDYLSQERALSAPIEFSEVEAFDFIAVKKHRINKWVANLGFRTFSAQTAGRLNKIFLHNLLNKKLAEISRVDRMQCFFKINSTTPGDVYWYRKYLELKEKLESTSCGN